MSVINLSLMAALNLLMLFLIQWIPVLYYGVSIDLDLIFASLVCFQFLNALLGSNLVQVMIPILVEEDETLEKGVFFVLIVYVLFCTLIICACLYWVVDVLVTNIYLNYTSAQQDYIGYLIELSLLGSLFSILCYAFSSVFYLRGKQFQFELFGCLSGIIAVLFLVLTLSHNHFENLVWSINLRWWILFIFTVLVSKGALFNTGDLSFQPIIKFNRRIKNLIVGGAVFKSDVFLDRYFSAKSQVGDLTILNLVQQCYAAINAVINKAYLSPNISFLSKLKKKAEIKQFYAHIDRMILQILKLISLIFLFLLSLFLLSFFIEFSLANILLNRWLQVALLCSGVLVGASIGAIFAVKYYSIGNTFTPTLVGLVGFFVGIISKVVGFNIFGFNGFLLAISFYYVFNIMFFLLLHLREKNIELN